MEKVLIRNKRHPERTKAIHARQAKLLVRAGNWEYVDGEPAAPFAQQPKVDYASDEAAEAANELGIAPSDLVKVSPSGKSGGYTVADVREAAELKAEA